MIADWDTNCLFVSNLLETQYPALFASLRAAVKGVRIKIIPDTADIWCRDYMPLQLDKDRFCQFVYAPGYLCGFEHLVTPPDKCRLAFMGNYRREPILLDGGNVVACRTKVILTEKVYKENPGIERPRLRDRLGELFQAECLFIPKQGGDDVGHSDGVVRFIAENRVLVSDYSTVDPGYGDGVRRVLEKKGLEIETLPMFEEKKRKRPNELRSAVGIYVNYLRVGDVVVVPGFGRAEDEAAVEKIRQVMPTAIVSQVQCRGLAEDGGVLNCISWTIKEKAAISA
jgi:agmatine/peptidylarginine deiminase